GLDERLLHFLHDHVLAERVDEMPSPPGDLEPQRVLGGHTHGVAEQVRPKAGRGAKRDRVRAADLDVGDRVPTGPVAAQVLDRDELVEDAVVEHEGEPAARLGLDRHEPLRRRYTSTRSRAMPIHSSKTRRYGAKETPPWISTRRF